MNRTFTYFVPVYRVRVYHRCTNQYKTKRVNVTVSSKFNVVLQIQQRCRIPNTKEERKKEVNEISLQQKDKVERMVIYRLLIHSQVNRERFSFIGEFFYDFTYTIMTIRCASCVYARERERLPVYYKWLLWMNYYYYYYDYYDYYYHHVERFLLTE